MWNCKDCGHSYQPSAFDYRDGDENICRYCGSENTRPIAKASKSGYKFEPEIGAQACKCGEDLSGIGFEVHIERPSPLTLKGSKTYERKLCPKCGTLYERPYHYYKQPRIKCKEVGDGN